MTTVKKYELYCETEATTVSTDYLLSAPTECPNNSGHTIDPDSIAIVDTVSDSDVNIVSTSEDLPTQHRGFTDLTGYNVYRKGFSYVVRAGTTREFEVKYSSTMKLQGMCLRVDENVNIGSNQLDPIPSENNSGTGIITQSDDYEHTIHHRKYTFTIKNKSGASFDVDWESDADTSGTLSNITDTYSQDIEVEDGLTLDFTDLDGFADDDVYNLTIDGGDYFEVEMVDADGIVYPAGTVLVTFAKTIHMIPNWIFECVCPDAKDLYNWVYVRIRYVSTYGTENVMIKFDHCMRTVPS